MAFNCDLCTDAGRTSTRVPRVGQTRCPSDDEPGQTPGISASTRHCPVSGMCTCRPATYPSPCGSGDQGEGPQPARATLWLGQAVLQQDQGQAVIPSGCQPQPRTASADRSPLDKHIGTETTDQETPALLSIWITRCDLSTYGCQRDMLFKCINVPSLPEQFSLQHNQGTSVRPHQHHHPKNCCMLTRLGRCPHTLQRPCCHRTKL